MKRPEDDIASPFPYVFPQMPPLLRGMDDLKEADRLHFMESKRIRYVKTSTCPLIIPSVCPECKCRFFDMADTDRQI